MDILVTQPNHIKAEVTHDGESGHAYFSHTGAVGDLRGVKSSWISLLSSAWLSCRLLKVRLDYLFRSGRDLCGIMTHLRCRVGRKCKMNPTRAQQMGTLGNIVYPSGYINFNQRVKEKPFANHIAYCSQESVSEALPPPLHKWIRFQMFQRRIKTMAEKKT